ncbi:glycosyltransferase family 2 protein [uncultured Hoeflea sp.]|uniref:glycosyltransferase family 2 protein n=1 Tax=uncultured Hoeflea sp. TaxID=538666 RepID=UPI00262C61A7|nr:glycosyltransferase family 2 protein [uncultured Hoeflea sp.]
MAPSKTPDTPRPGGSDSRLRLIKTAFAPPPEDPETAAERSFFVLSGIGKPHVQAAAQAAATNGTTLENELIAARLIDSHLYYRWMAGELGLDYIDEIQTGEVIRLPSMDVLLHRDGPLRLSRDGRLVTVIVPEARRLAAEKTRLDAKPNLRHGLAVAAPATMRKAVWQAGAQQRVRRTTFQLDQRHRNASARQVLTGSQGFVLAMLICMILAGFLVWPFSTIIALHVLMTPFFSGALLLRLWALMTAPTQNKAATRKQQDHAPPPIYTLLIALRDEAEMAPAIVSRIGALQWPRSRLDIKFICEAGDEATINALRAQNIGPECEIVEVPDFGPRTKPKALQYALQGARGSLVAVYDAEDKPAPGQLLEAWDTFRTSDDRLACLQAPLAIANMGANWLSGLFSLEYSGLFRILIPFLARTGMPIPLGGTSNHFRRAALEDVGGWDPHNVTEDADLGLRLYARGYKTGIIRSATLEVSPVTLGVWIRQRTRWLKGWAQTWLVVMRHPARTVSALGPLGFVVFQLMIAGMLVSALTHPLMFMFIALTLFSFVNGNISVAPHLHAALLWVDIVNILGSYLIFGLIGWCRFSAYERAKVKIRWLTLVPVYWLLMSYAGWRALVQLIRNAHLWEKTPHPADPLHTPPPERWRATSWRRSSAATQAEAHGMVERVKGIEPSS